MTTLPTRRLLPGLAAAMTVLAGMPSAHAAVEIFVQEEPLDQPELAELRGGMMINGIPVNFAVVVSTTAEGAVNRGLQTTLTVNDQGGLGSSVTTALGGQLVTRPDGSLAVALPGGGAIVHEVMSDHVSTLVANTMKGMTLRQSTDLNVEMPGFLHTHEVYSSNWQASQMGLAASLGALGHR